MRPVFQGQNITKQICDFIELGVDKKNIYCDQKYGEFSEYKKLRGILQQGDTLYIKSLRVLGTETTQIIGEWNKLKEDFKVYVNVLELYMMDIGEDNENIESYQLVKNILDFSMLA